MNNGQQPAAVIAAFAKIARPIMRQWMTKNSCIGAARTTIEVMKLYGLRATAKPVSYAFQVPARQYARVGGFSAAEEAEMRARANSWQDEKTGGWNGHLLVLVADRWLLDPALDQMDSPEYGVALPEEVFVIDTDGNPFIARQKFDMRLGLVLDNGDKAELMYRSIEDLSYRLTEAWTDEGLPLLAQFIVNNMERANAG